MPTPHKFFSIASILFVGLAAFLSNHYFGVSWIAAYLIAVNLLAFALCGYDKSISPTGATRVPEVVFYSIALLGGAVGLLVGMVKFRHKTKKASFQFTLLVILVVQLGLARVLW